MNRLSSVFWLSKGWRFASDHLGPFDLVKRNWEFWRACWPFDCGCGLCDCNGVSVLACAVSCLQLLPYRQWTVLLEEHLQLLQLRSGRAQAVKQIISLLISEITVSYSAHDFFSAWRVWTEKIRDSPVERLVNCMLNLWAWGPSNSQPGRNILSTRQTPLESAKSLWASGSDELQNHLWHD